MADTLLHRVPPPGALHEPRQRQPSLPSTRASLETSEDAEDSASSRPWAIVVDDDPDWLELVALGLRDRGYRVSTFERGDDVLASADLHRADVAVVDYRLPGSDGVTLCRAMHEIRPTLRTIVCTGDREVDAVVAALREGVGDYLLKPVSIEDLDRCIRALLHDEARAHHVSRKTRLELESGKMIPGTPYRLDGWVGEGGMGTVYRGTHVAIERQVALKVLHREHCMRELSVRTFRNEARASARIGAPNIVDILDFAELADGRLLIAMELLDGVALDEVLRRETVELERIVAIGRQICRGLAAAHDAGVVHRDVKPANVMLVHREGRPDFVKLVDFGIAVFQADVGGVHQVAGTPQYMAPEAIQYGTIDPGIDQYALGCLLYEWATGAPPFEGSVEEILHAHVDTEPPPPSRQDGRQIPAELEEVILRCLAKHADDRYLDMHEVEAALCEVQIELGLRTAYDDLPLPAIDEERRAQLAARMPQRRPRATPRQRRRALAVFAGVSLAILAIAGWQQRSAAKAEEARVVEAEVGSRVEAARLAASRFQFLYPPVDDPDAVTAYAHVVALEALGSDAARQAAADVRADLAEALVRQGDRYWEFEHGRGFAREFYAMALVFDDHPRARERAVLTAATLDELRARAASGDFVEGELIAAQSLAALAEEDPEARSKKLQALAEDPEQPTVVATRLEKLDGESTAAARRGRPSASGRGVSASATPAPAATAALPTPEPIVTHAPKPRTAAAELRRARRARTLGRLEAAEQHYHRAIEADPGNLGALDGLASLHYDAGAYGKSVRFARLAADRGPKDGRRWLLLGDAYFKVLRYADAIEAYERAAARGVSQAGARIAKVRAKTGRSP